MLWFYMKNNIQRHVVFFNSCRHEDLSTRMCVTMSREELCPNYSRSQALPTSHQWHQSPLQGACKSYLRCPISSFVTKLLSTQELSAVVVLRKKKLPLLCNFNILCVFPKCEQVYSYFLRISNYIKWNQHNFVSCGTLNNTMFSV